MQCGVHMTSMLRILVTLHHCSVPLRANRIGCRLTGSSAQLVNGTAELFGAEVWHLHDSQSTVKHASS